MLAKPVRTRCTTSLHFVTSVESIWGVNGVPDSTRRLNFRHVLEQHEFGAAVLTKVGELLQVKGMKLSGGTHC